MFGMIQSKCDSKLRKDIWENEYISHYIEDSKCRKKFIMLRN